MKRIISVLTVAALMAMMLMVMAAPALAKVDRSTTTVGTTNVEKLVTPSDRVNAHGHFRPAERQGGGGGGAKHFSSDTGEQLQVSPDGKVGIGGATGKAVETPSGNFNSTFHGEI